MNEHDTPRELRLAIHARSRLSEIRAGACPDSIFCRLAQLARIPVLSDLSLCHFSTFLQAFSCSSMKKSLSLRQLSKASELFDLNR